MEDNKLEPKEVWRKMSRRISAVQHVLHPGEENPGYLADEDIPDEEYLNMRRADHTPHDLFVEMDELEGDIWVEKARWMKYEEELDPERQMWSQPHVSNLSFQAIIRLRICLEDSLLMLDIDAADFPEVVEKVISRAAEQAKLTKKVQAQVRKVLHYRHQHVSKHGMMTRKESHACETRNKLLHMSGKDDQLNKDLKVDMPKSRRASLAHEPASIFAQLKPGTEGSMSLVGHLSCIEKPLVAFVRLAEAVEMPKTSEISIRVRFIFIAFTPASDIDLDHHEIGRTMSTMMANPGFHNNAYKIEDKKHLLMGMDEFLDGSIMLPPGDWDRRNLLPMPQMIQMRKRMKERQAAKGGGSQAGPVAPHQNGTTKTSQEAEPVKIKRNPLIRTSTPFGGLIDDIRHRYPLYLADIKDGLNAQCIAATIFIYFAALSGAIAFGGLMGSSTNNEIGISETLIVSAVSGLFFALFSGCPLIIIGTTGPVLLYDQALFSFCEGTLPGQFLPWRFWIGLWTFVISLLVAGFQGSTLVRYFTRFTKDIFNALVALLFIVSAFEKLGKIFGAHPLSAVFSYCSSLPGDCLEDLRTNASYTYDPDVHMAALVGSDNTTYSCAIYAPPERISHQPNTALLSMFLMLGTFFIAYWLRIIRTSSYMGKNVRKAMGDFGVPIAIVIMVGVSIAAQDTYVEKLTVPEGITVTNSTLRGWLIPPTGMPGLEAGLPIWAMVVAVLPAILLYLLLFMETHICELIMMEKTKEEKGAGLHLDIVLLSLINFACGAFGGPWICAATVRAVSHVSALAIMGTALPGEPVKVVAVRDQRVTAAMVSILLGVSVAMAPILRLVPFAVLFGVFLYMGVSGMNGVQFFDRVFLCFQHPKHHPNVSYAQKVKPLRMVLFTVMQALGLVALWIVKSIPAIALAFPFVVAMMIPYRASLKYIFTETELEMLDGNKAGQNLSGEKKDNEDEQDFYASAAFCTVQPGQNAALHRGLMSLIQATTVVGDLK